MHILMAKGANATKRDLETIGGRLAFAINDIGLSSSYAVARATGLSESTISRIIRNKTTPNYNTIRAIGLQVGVNPEWILRGGDDSVRMTPDDILFFEKHPDYVPYLQDKLIKLEASDKEPTPTEARPRFVEVKKNLISSEAESLDIIRITNHTEFRSLGNEQFLIITRMVEARAYDRYYTEYFNDEYLSDLPRHAVVLNRLYLGTYRSFFINEGSIAGTGKFKLEAGMIATGRRFDKKLATREMDFVNGMQFVIILKSRTIFTTVNDWDADQMAIICPDPQNERKPLVIYSQDIREIYQLEAVTQI